MTIISANVVAAATNPDGFTLWTMELVYPRFIHSEFMTHRAFSRNASSSRAIPIARQIEMIEENPVIPLFWGKNQKGMQATEECNEMIPMPDRPFSPDTWSREDVWRDACVHAITLARRFAGAGYHKQIVNRLLEPFAHIRVLVSSTEWNNFFNLRDHEDAEPHIRLLAQRIKAAMADYGPPLVLPFGHWHLPYIDVRRGLQDGAQIFFNAAGGEMDLATAVKVSAARCARVSYNLHDGRPSTTGQDMDLYKRLVGSEPLHASPLEHQAVATHNHRFNRNFRGWLQLRTHVEKGWDVG